MNNITDNPYDDVLQKYGDENVELKAEVERLTKRIRDAHFLVRATVIGVDFEGGRSEIMRRLTRAEQILREESDDRQLDDNGGDNE